MPEICKCHDAWIYKDAKLADYICEPLNIWRHTRFIVINTILQTLHSIIFFPFENKLNVLL